MDRLSADRMFAAVVRLGGFSAAAAQLGTSAGQASKLVSRLETHLGVRLLNRTTRAIALTAEGEAYFSRITAILEQLDDLDDSLREAGRDPRGQIRLTAPLSFGTIQLMPALTHFACAHPNIALDVQFSDSAMGLAEHGFDAAIRVGLNRDSSLKGRKLGITRSLVVASPDYLARHGTPDHPAELADHQIVTDTNYPRPDDWTFAPETEGGVTLHLPGRIRLANGEACVIAAAAGLGIARAPDFISAPAIRAGHLVEILPGSLAGVSAIQALIPEGRHLPTRLRLLLDFLRNRWGPDHDWTN